LVLTNAICCPGLWLEQQMPFDRLRRRDFITLLGSAVWPLAARAQLTMPVVGFLGAESPGSVPRWVEGFRGGIAETGYEESRNVVVTYHWAEGHYDRLPALAADLILHRVAAIVAAGVDAAHAAKAATSTIPIVFFMSGDPVAEGLVVRLNQPGGNLTGITSFSGALTSKRLQLLHELVPAATIVAVLINPTNSNANFRLKEIDEARRILSLQIEVVNAGNGEAIDAAFASLVRSGAGALSIVDDPAFNGSERSRIVRLAAQHRIPTMYFQSEFVSDGGLISYGTNFAEQFRQIGIYTGQILKGARPADLPVLQPTKFELVINLTTAKALGLTIPDKLLGLANEVIE
jgi:putative ABC transport system substrate-binding protein